METKVIDKLRRFAYAYDEICKISKKLRRMFEADCNFGNTERRDKQEENLEKKAQSYLDNLDDIFPNLKIYVQGDPRGCSLYIVDKAILATGNYTDGVAC